MHVCFIPAVEVAIQQQKLQLECSKYAFNLHLTSILYSNENEGRDTVNAMGRVAWLFAAGRQLQQVRHCDGIHAVKLCNTAMQYAASLVLNRTRP